VLTRPALSVESQHPDSEKPKCNTKKKKKKKKKNQKERQENISTPASSRLLGFLFPGNIYRCQDRRCPSVVSAPRRRGRVKKPD
jgi:hypothetical protein